jgi:cytochrome c-type biogenesis protein CcmH
MTRLAVAAALLALTLLAAGPARAARPDEMLADPRLEQRAEEVGKELRCLVCRNQSVEDSDADLAHDLRVLVRERISAGDSDAQVIAYVRSRYGDFVLLRPPLELGTALLWGGPILLLLIGAAMAFCFYRGQPPVPATPPLTDDERKRLDRVLADGVEP